MNTFGEYFWGQRGVTTVFTSAVYLAALQHNKHWFTASTSQVFEPGQGPTKGRTLKIRRGSRIHVMVKLEKLFGAHCCDLVDALHAVYSLAVVSLASLQGEYVTRYNT